MSYVIGQWERKSIPVEGGRIKERWMPPVAGARLGRIDLRPVPARALSTPDGFGLFELDPADGIPQGFLDLGNSLTARLTQAQRDGLAARFSNTASADFDTPTLGDAIWRLLTELADPTGDNLAPPVMPGHDGTIRLRIGLSKRDEKYAPAKHPHVLTVARLNYARVAARDDIRNRTLEAQGMTRLQVKQAIVSNYLNRLARKLGVRPQDIAVPSGGATFEDTFVEAGSDVALGSHTPTGANAGSGWSVLNGSWNVQAANDIAHQTTVTDPGSSRLDDDLDSDDMTSFHGVFSFGTFRAAGPLGRYASAAETYYAYSRDNSNSFSHELFSRVNGGTPTSLADPVDDFDDPFPTGIDLTLTIDGSDLEGFQDGVSFVTVTDTGITGNTRGGIYSDESLANTGMGFSDYTVEDVGGVAPPAAPVRRMFMMTGVGR